MFMVPYYCLTSSAQPDEFYVLQCYSLFSRNHFLLGTSLPRDSDITASFVNCSENCVRTGHCQEEEKCSKYYKYVFVCDFRAYSTSNE